MLLVARIDPLWAVACKKIDIADKSRRLLDHRHTVFLRGPWIDSGLEYDDIPLRDDRADGLAGSLEQAEIGSLGGVDGRRHCDNVEIARFQIVGRGGEMYRRRPQCRPID